MSLANDLRMGLRFARGLGPFLRKGDISGDPESIVRAMSANRESTFLDTLHRGIYGNPQSPYLALLQHAGIAEQDIISRVEAVGIEPTLQELYERGIYITLDEFKGRVPITRPGLELPVTTASFDNPLSRAQLQGVTGGSRTQGTRIKLDLDDFTNEEACGLLWQEANHTLGLPKVYWRVAAPAIGALKWILIWTRAGVRVTRWYSQTRPGPRQPGGPKGVIIHSTTWLVTALAGRPTPYPRYAPMSAADRIARYLARLTAKGVHVSFDTIASSAVEICRVANALNLDISGHHFETFSEPLTPAKARVIYAAGCSCYGSYGMEDAGRLGDACGTPNALDDMHLLTYRTAFLQIPKTLPGWPQPVGALYLTSLRPTAPKMLLNVETGDYGVMSERQCGCPLGRAGLTTHLHTIRNYEKLTSAGMHFMGADLLEILEVILPKRYGGAPTDYQFVEAEEDARTVLKLVIHPRIGQLSENEVKAFVLDELERRTAGGRLMTDIWRDSETLQIERKPPYATSSSKIQPLHVAASRLRPSQ